MSNIKSNFTKPILLIFLLSIAYNLYSQSPKISRDWEQIALNQFEKVKDTSFQSYDYSSIISNQLRIDRDPWSTYVGVFGSQNQRIDFHITAFKSINKSTYSIKGKSKLGSNIRDLTGEIKIKHTLKILNNVFIMLFDYDFKEPGNKDGDGQFIGIGSFVFTLKNNQPKIFWSEAGEYREYNNMFVGIWKKYKLDKSLDCIFSFNASGTWTKLPFRDNLYKTFKDEDECKCYFEIKDEFRQYGWKNHIDSDIYKDYWWK